ncbi:MAG: hypothetical protein AAGI03_02095 [Pseudomonadota bacterium]
MSDWTLVTHPHPFKSDRVITELPYGVTLADALADKGPMVAIHQTVLGAAEIPADRFAGYKPRSGIVTATPAVQGPAVGLVAAIGVSFGATIGGGLVAGAVGGTLGLLAGAATTAAISVVGSLAINALIPPPRASNAVLPSLPGTASSFVPQASPQRAAAPAVGGSPVYSITGTRNTETPYGPFPLVLGRHKMYPPVVARGYTTFEGDDVIYHGRFTFGFGRVALEQIRIGDTPITQFDDVELEFANVDSARTLAAMPGLAGMVRAWRMGSEQIQIGADDVVQEGLSILLETGTAVARTTAENTAAAVVDLEASPGYIAFNPDGSTAAEHSSYRINWWGTGGSGTKDVQLRGKQLSVLRKSFYLVFPSAGQYTVQITRLDVNEEQSGRPDDRTVYDDVYWTALKSYQPTRIRTDPDIAEVAIRIRASEQLNGELDTFSAVVQQLGREWDGSSWSGLQPIRHPAWVLAAFMRGAHQQRPIPDSQIDLDAFKSWADEEPHWRADTVVDQSTTNSAVCEMIAAAGRARVIMRDLKYSVIRETAAGPVVGHLTPMNSSGFSGRIVFPKQIHGFRVRAISVAKDWQLDELTVYAKGYNAANATEFETLELPAVIWNSNKQGNAYKLARYHLAQAILRPETFEVTTSLDHLRWNVGDKIRVTHDVPLIGVGSGRVISINGQNVVLDNRLTEAANLSVTVRFAQAGGVELSYDGLIAANGTLDLSSAVGVQVGDIAQVSRSGSETFDAIITEIQQAPDLTAVLKLVPAAPGVLSTGPVPDYTPVITPRSTYQNPPVPVIREVFSGVAALQINPFGPDTPRIGIRFDLISLAGVFPASIEVRHRIMDLDGWTPTQNLPFRELAFVPIDSERELYDVQARFVSVSGARSPWTSTRTVYAASDLTKPGPVQSFAVEVLGETANLTWARVNKRVVAYQIRYSRYPAGIWEQSTIVLERVEGTTAQVPARQGSYLIKGISVSGDFSDEASLVSIESVGFARNVVETAILGPPFSAPAPWSLDGDSLIFDPRDHGALEALYDAGTEIDLGAVYSVTCVSDLDVSAEQNDFDIFNWSDLFEIEDIFGAVSADWNASVEARFSSKPAGDSAPDWSDWRPVRFQELRGRTFQFRLAVSVPNEAISVRVVGTSITLDVPDRLEADRNVAVPSDGLRVDFSTPFWALRGLSIEGESLPSGFRSERSNVSRSGFDIRFYDASNTPIAATIDWIASGYGREDASATV